MNNLSSYCGLVDAKIRASDKDLPVIGPSSIYNMTLLSTDKKVWKMGKIFVAFPEHLNFKRMSLEA